MSVLDTVKSKCFIGVECEGPNQGAFVLFVPGTVTAWRFEKVFEEQQHKIDRIYFGAGNDHSFNDWNTLAAIIKTCVPTDVETDYFVPVQHRHKVNCIALTKCFAEKADWFKTVDKKLNRIAWQDTRDPENVYITCIDDPRFELDKDVE